VSTDPAEPDLRRGDAFDLVQDLAPASVDLILTSPPYWGHRSYGLPHNEGILAEWGGESVDETVCPRWDWYRAHGGVLGQEPLPNWYVAHLAEFFVRARPCLKASGSVWLNLGDTYWNRWTSVRDGGRRGLGSASRTRRRTPMGGYCQEKQLLLIPARVAIEMQEHRWILRNDLIWRKGAKPLPGRETDRLRNDHEHLLHFVLRPSSGRARYWYDLDATEPGHVDVIECAPARGKSEHSARFPEDLIRPRVLSSCPPGGLVLDPFAGTGTTLRVAAETGRRAIGFEITPQAAGRT
jgi:DNA modification methylase